MRDSWTAKGLAVTIVAIGALLCRSGLADPPAPQPGPAATAPRRLTIEALPPPASPYVTDDEIGQAIRKAAKYLAGRFTDSTLVESGAFAISSVPDGQGPGQPGNNRPAAPAEEDSIRTERRAGADALVVYALLQSGMATGDPQFAKDSQSMKPLIDKMKTLSSHRYDIYAKALRATCLALINRQEDRKVLESDVRDLIDACSNGAYSYTNPGNFTHVGSGIPVKTPNGIVIDRSVTTVRVMNAAYDNSNSQYGLLGVWSAAEIGAEIPPNYWPAIQNHWTQCQCPDGQWGYQGNMPGTYSMTMAGLASMFVCHDYIDLTKFGSQVGREPLSPALARGLAWMETGDNSVPPAANDGYSTYGLERVGLASGFKYFGTHDWYRQVATQLVKTQSPDGWWNDSFQLGTDCDTAYMLLFLARGRHPILMNKLRFEHYWDNRPRDLANLAGYADTQLESPMNWQVVDLKHDWSDWTDSPILYIASQEAPKFTDEDYAKIRAFVNSGGMLFTQADGDSADFNEYAETILLKKVFPEYKLQSIPATSTLYSVFSPMQIKPRLLGISNGARFLWVHSPEDIAVWWQQRAMKTHKQAFDLGMNLFIYAAGKRDFQNRIATNYIPTPDAAAGEVVKVARVKYALPTWDPEPYAWTRFANYLQWQTSVKVQAQTVDMLKLGEVSPADVPLAALTGTTPFTPSDAEIQSLREYVSNGGILFIDACGGATFNDSARTMLARAFPKVTPDPLLPSSPLLKRMLNGMSELPATPPVRQYVTSLGAGKTQGMETFAVGKGQVIYSPMDITNGLLGSQTWGIAGYAGPYCLDFMKNLVLWSAQGESKTPQVAAAPPGPPPGATPRNVTLNLAPAGDDGGAAGAATHFTGQEHAAAGAGAVYHDPQFLQFSILPQGAVTTDEVGGTGRLIFRSVSLHGDEMLGVRYNLEDVSGKQVIHQIEPIFAGTPAPENDAAFTSVKARDGYAVAGMLDDDDRSNIVAVKIIFARFKDGRVDMSDAYLSDWIGKSDGRPLKQLAGRGERVIGMFGRHDADLNSLGLIVIPPENPQRQP